MRAGGGERHCYSRRSCRVVPRILRAREHCAPSPEDARLLFRLAVNVWASACAFATALLLVEPLISHYEHLVAEESLEWGPEAAARGAAERLLPILMTALVTGLALLPLAIMSGEPGNEIEGPMAIVILGASLGTIPQGRGLIWA